MTVAQQSYSDDRRGFALIDALAAAAIAAASLTVFSVSISNIRQLTTRVEIIETALLEAQNISALVTSGGNLTTMDLYDHWDINRNVIIDYGPGARLEQIHFTHNDRADLQYVILRVERAGEASQ